jgi:hypothetical protein
MVGLAIGGALRSPKPAVDAALNKAKAFEGALAYANRPIIDNGSGAGTVIPAPDTDPEAVAAWWSSLSTDTKQELMAKNPAELGKLHGLPAEDADKVNRTRLDADVDRLESDLSNTRFAISSMENSTRYGDGRASQELYDRRDRLEAELSNAKDMKKQIEILDGDHAAGRGPKPYLLTYQYQNDGRFAVALGDPDAADNTAVLVPGSGHDVKKDDGHEILFPTVQEGQRLLDEMGRTAPAGQKNSVIVWLGADMPDAPIPDGLNPTYGDSGHGARWLHDDVAGYQAAITNPDNHITILAHSYGSYMASGAIKLGLDVDDLVVFGSPGLTADNAAELGMQGHVWAGRADGDDLVTHGWLGANPTSESFGAQVFATDGAEDHNDYLNEDSESLENIAEIATGEGAKISRREPDPERTPFDYFPTGTT